MGNNRKYIYKIQFIIQYVGNLRKYIWNSGVEKIIVGNE